MNTIYDNTFTIGQTSAINFEAGPGISITEPTAGTVRIGNDETVLYEGTTTSQVPQSSIVLSEPATNFEKLDILYFDRYGNISDSKTINTTNMTFENGNTSRVRLQAPFMYNATSPMYMRVSQYKFSNTTTMTFEANGQIEVTTTGIQSTYSTTPNNQGCFIYKVIGINRIGGNA